MVNRTGEPNRNAVFAGEPNQAAEMSQYNLPKSLRTFSSFNEELFDPKKVEKYKRFMPGADERIVAMMEKQQEHRHRLQKT